MKPAPLYIYAVETDGLQFSNARTPAKKSKLEEISGKELMFRLVAVGQSIRLMMIFFVIIAIINIVGFVAIISKLFG